MTINSKPLPRMRPVVDFDWTPKGGLLAYTAGGDTYPPSPLHTGDTRYQAFTTPTNTQITFTANVVVAHDAFVVGYVWNFGDNTTGYGHQVTHTFPVTNPALEVTLVARDNWGQESSAAHVLNLVSLNAISAAPVIRV